MAARPNWRRLIPPRRSSVRMYLTKSHIAPPGLVNRIDRSPYTRERMAIISHCSLPIAREIGTSGEWRVVSGERGCVSAPSSERGCISPRVNEFTRLRETAERYEHGNTVLDCPGLQLGRCSAHSCILAGSADTECNGYCRRPAPGHRPARHSCISSRGGRQNRRVDYRRVRWLAGQRLSPGRRSQLSKKGCSP